MYSHLETTVAQCTKQYNCKYHRNGDCTLRNHNFFSYRSCRYNIAGEKQLNSQPSPLLISFIHHLFLKCTYKLIIEMHFRKFPFYIHACPFCKFLIFFFIGSNSLYRPNNFICQTLVSL